MNIIKSFYKKINNYFALSNILIDDISRIEYDKLEKVKSQISNSNSLYNHENNAHLNCKININCNSTIEIIEIQNSLFVNNLQLIDSKLPEIISYLLIYNKVYNINNLPKLIGIINKENPIDYEFKFSHPFYENKIKNFLFACAIGMNTSEVWDGRKEFENGLTLLKSTDGLNDILIYNKSEFQKYLLNNTKLEQASTSEDKNNPGNAKTNNAKPYKFGWVYEEDGELFIKLNLQIRFNN